MSGSCGQDSRPKVCAWVLPTPFLIPFSVMWGQSQLCGEGVKYQDGLGD